MSKRLLLIAAPVLIVFAAGLFYAEPSAGRRGNGEPAPQPASARQEAHRRRRAGERLSGVGVIEGQVINAEGQPIGGAKVCAESDDALTGRRASTRSDDAGYFRIEVEEPGRYSVCGSKEEDGYPLNISGFHREEGVSVPKVNVELNQTVSGVILQLGARASILEGVITDSADRLPISKAAITLRRADRPDVFFTIGVAEYKKNGTFKVLVPNVPFMIEVDAPGYEAWAYSKAGVKGHPDALIVNRGQTKKLEIALRAKKTP
jgi:hypothetical protein